MSPSEARTIIEALANGADPETGECLPGEGPLARAPIVRALFAASKALAESAERARVDAARPGMAGKAWSEEEDARLAQAFDSGEELRDLATRHQRSTGGIRTRLVRLGRLQESVEAS